MPNYTLNVNGRDQTVSVSSSSMPLLWVLRDVLGLTGTKYGCGIEICGACTVWVNGQVVFSEGKTTKAMAGRPVKRPTARGIVPVPLFSRRDT